MAAYSPTSLAQQLSRNSTPYHDPVGRIRWEQLRTDQYWLPPEAMSLHGLPAFMALPFATRQRLSQYEFLNFIEGGLWLEGLFMERIARSMRDRRQDLSTLKYHLHELREEAGHSLMFLELMERSGLAIPYGRQPGARLAEWFGRHAPLESLGFAMALVIGEEVPDRLNRYVRAHSQDVSPVILEICTAHVIDEARHIAHARETLERHLAGLGRARRALLRPLMQRILRQFIEVFYFPRPELYELAGLYPGTDWAQAARRSHHRAEFVSQCVNPTLQLLRSRGFALRWR